MKGLAYSQPNIPILKETVLKITNLSKSYGKIRALADLNLEIDKGQVFGLLGPNGSGKTTTLGIVLGVIRAKSGSFDWFGEPVSPTSLRRIGAILEHPNFFPYLSAFDNLRIIARIRGVADTDIERVLGLVGLAERRTHRFQTYSYGMKQRLAIAAAMLGSPEVLILDEPTNGLDPSGIAEIRELIIKIASDGTTIVLASHMLDEVQKVCSHVAVLEKGNKLFSGRVEDVLNSTEIIEVAAGDMSLLEKTISSFPAYRSHNTINNLVELKVIGECKPGEVNDFLFARGIVCTHLKIRRKTLENYFLELVGKNSGTNHIA